ncbi:sugar ABC transporter ATP-binding protein [Aquibium microcysteis]|uniref:sugar ABC transporter ATP-binding protein n=1 Tax=Aquibium microcysteis TaxID=675281 RepID=UPI001EF3739F|nr:sugar ABC transporter ATP-binding protein [Aquibium microcysteis]
MAEAGSSNGHAPGMPAGSEMVRFENVTKRFGAHVALRDVSLVGRAGSVHAVTGENGAGKSTLMNLLAGVHQPSSGTIYLDGKPVVIAGPREAHRAGVSTVYQELTLLPNLTVAENLFLGREPRRMGMVDRAAMRRDAGSAFRLLDVELDPDIPCGDLTIAQQQMVEIAKGVAVAARVFIFDEPTAALNGPEIEKLERLILSLKRDGKLVFYISHRLDEIFRFCDTISVMKDGSHVATRPADELTRDMLVSLMVGRELDRFFPHRGSVRADAEAAIEVDSLVPVAGAPAVSFTLRRGEILGLTGLEGQGQREIIRAVAGQVAPVSGEVSRHAGGGGSRPLLPSPVAAARAGVGFVPEDRKSEGLFLPLGIDRNVGVGMLRLSSVWSRARIDRERLAGLLESMKVRATGPQQEVQALSGGNQQKVLIGRWLAAGVDILLVEEPTRGVDVGAKSEIYTLLRAFADDGGAVLMTSSELSEHIGLCDRILVVREGRLVADMPGAAATEETIMSSALTGLPFQAHAGGAS